MKIGCVCVTEDRAPIWGIALASFIAQNYQDAVLHVYAHPLTDYINGAMVRLTDFSVCTPLDTWPLVSAAVGVEGKLNKVAALLLYNRQQTGLQQPLGKDAVPAVLDVAIQKLFDNAGCDLVTIWDDDDFAPVDRLTRTAEAFKRFFSGIGQALDKLPVVGSYRSGYMVNLRTLENRKLELDHFWGGCLTFNRQAWLQADGFSDNGRASNPGYDRQFVKRLQQRGVVGSLNLAGDAPNAQLPFAFCHDKNVASFCVGEDVVDDAEAVRAALPPSVRREVLRAQQLLIERRVFPDGTGDSRK